MFGFIATLCSPTSCNGGICTATQNNIVCVCPIGKFGDRCQVRTFFFFLINNTGIFSMKMHVQQIHVYQLNDVNK